VNDYKLFMQRIGLVGITNILIALSSLILLPIITKSFSIGDYGVWVQFNTTIALIPNLATLGLPYTMVRFLSAEKNKKKIQESFYSITIMVFASSFVISTIMFFFSKDIASTLFNNDVNLTILLSIIIFLACLNSLLLNFFRTLQQMKRYSIFLLIQTYLGVFIVSYFAINGLGIYMAALGLLIATLITFFIMITFIISNIGVKIPKFRNIRKYLSFGIPTIPGNLSSWVVDSSDRYIIGIFLSTVFVGYYSPGYTLGNIIIMIVAPFSLLLPSILPGFYDNGEIEKVKTFLRYSLKYFFLIAIPSTFGLSLLSKPLLMLLTTPEIALNGYIITPFIAVSALIYGAYAIISNVLILEKKTKILGTIWIIAAILNLVFNIILVPYFGIIGAAAVTLVSFIIAFYVTLVYSNKYFHVELELTFILKSVLASVLMSMLIFIINPHGIIQILTTILICSGSYLALIIVLSGIKKEEILFFKNMINS